MSVYFIQALTGGPIKIGVTTGPIRGRLSTLQTASPVPLVVLRETEGDYEAERDLHMALAAHRLSGEWFADHPDVRAAMIAAPALVQRPRRRRRAAPRAPQPPPVNRFLAAERAVMPRVAEAAAYFKGIPLPRAEFVEWAQNDVWWADNSGRYLGSGLSWSAALLGCPCCVEGPEFLWLGVWAFQGARERCGPLGMRVAGHLAGHFVRALGMPHGNVRNIMPVDADIEKATDWREVVEKWAKASTAITERFHVGRRIHPKRTWCYDAGCPIKAPADSVVFP